MATSAILDKCVYTISLSRVLLSYLTILSLLARVAESKQAACRSSNFGKPVGERKVADREPVIVPVHPITEQVIHH